MSAGRASWRATAAYSRIIGATEGVIMPTIMTIHMSCMKTK